MAAKAWTVCLLLGAVTGLLLSCDDGYERRGTGRRTGPIGPADDDFVSRMLERPEFDVPGSFDAYVTWRDYDGHSRTDEVMHVWNGHNVGRGGRGFRRVLSRLAALPPRSVVLLYPYYPALGALDEGIGHWIPYGGGDLLSQLDAVVERRQLTVRRSLRDHRGALHPHAIEVLSMWGVDVGRVQKR